jgi:hypothetical protein
MKSASRWFHYTDKMSGLIPPLPCMPFMALQGCRGLMDQSHMSPQKFSALFGSRKFVGVPDHFPTRVFSDSF